MIFTYQARTKEGTEQKGNIDASSMDGAIASLQRRELIVISINPVDEGNFLSRNIALFERVKMRDIVILSRQISTLFEAKVSVLSAFRLLASEAENPVLKRKLVEITDDIKGGMAISAALSRHPDVFSDFFINMIKSGEESGKLSETFLYLADYLERSYAVMSKAKNALVYPIFVICSFVVVMILMMVLVIPRLSQILLESGQEIPIYTKIVIGTSNFLVNYGIFLLLLLAAVGVFLWKYSLSSAGKLSFSRTKLSIPYIGVLYRKLYLSRISDNLATLVESGISMVRALEITAEVVDNQVYQEILKEASLKVKGGMPVSEALALYPEIPGIIIQMIKVGEESGKFGYVLETMAKFYAREVNNEVDTIVGLIEPAMIVVLGIGVGVLLTSVLVPIYNIASGI